jgi:Tfp pilus tip-associated adhesin PilY1
MENPMDESGKPMDEFETPFVWEIDNKDAFNSVGECMGTFARHQRTPFHHAITFTESTQHEMDNNSSYYTPVCKVDMGVNYEHTKEDDETLSHFLDWIKNKNDYVFKEWDNKNTKRQEEMPDEDMEVVEDFIDIELEEGEEK